MKLSTFFTWKEATTTNTGIPNEPDNEVHRETIITTAGYMDTVREFLGAPVYINSWYRNFAVNRAVGGVPNSQHSKGEAVDFRCPAYGTPYDICLALTTSNTPFDQLILEPTWVHISFTCRRSPRGQVLTLMKDRSYAQGLHPTK